MPRVEAFLLKAISIDPRSLEFACQLLLNYHKEGKRLSKDRISRRFVPLVERALTNDRHYEAAWGLFLMRGMGIPATENVIDRAKDYEGAVVPLLLLDMFGRGLTPTLPKRHWERRLQGAGDWNGWHWLLAYEGLRRNWLRDPTGRILRHSFFAPMATRSVTFYDEQRDVLARTEFVRRRVERNRALRTRAVAFFAGYQ
jgi:hypothetical protein